MTGNRTRYPGFGVWTPTHWAIHGPVNCLQSNPINPIQSFQFNQSNPINSIQSIQSNQSNPNKYKLPLGAPGLPGLPLGAQHSPFAVPVHKIKPPGTRSGSTGSTGSSGSSGSGAKTRGMDPQCTRARGQDDVSSQANSLKIRTTSENI